MQAFVDYAVMKTYRRVVLCLRSLTSRMMLKGMTTPGIPCKEDEEFFQWGPDADNMEEAMTKFFYGMEGQERSGFKDQHRFLGHLPVRCEGRSLNVAL